MKKKPIKLKKLFDCQQKLLVVGLAPRHCDRILIFIIDSPFLYG
jgi:hypothetical protein